MTTEDRKHLIGVIGSMILDRLPDEAIRFLFDYLMTSSVDDKLGHVIEESRRLFNRSGFNHHEHVDFKEST